MGSPAGTSGSGSAELVVELVVDDELELEVDVELELELEVELSEISPELQAESKKTPSKESAVIDFFMEIPPFFPFYL